MAEGLLEELTNNAAPLLALVILHSLLRERMRREERWGPWLLAVAASLGGWAALLPWCLGWTWPGPSLVALGLVLLLSPLADRYLATAGTAAPPASWMSLRARMAGGLGTLTLLLGIATPLLS